MIFLDRVLSFNRPHLTASLVVRAASAPLREKQLLTPVIGVEYISQAIAAYAALDDEKRREARMGYLVSMRHVRCYTAGFSPGETLVAAVELEAEEGSFASFSGSLSLGESIVLMEGKFHVFHEASQS